ncbi:MAG: hypothetical protein JNL41_10070 [Phenylobacterium sp.]|uniref:hypothetical protein n=1 Tax=Phenylobacterium sp. TaxID=1871053 RepID=UPI001A59A768|nr:hypothetical protein [Phenylobacterium sp.]MBL8554612.1 hypothetical protein [Phenylobacterium sp.]
MISFIWRASESSLGIVTRPPTKQDSSKARPQSNVAEREVKASAATTSDRNPFPQNDASEELTRPNSFTSRISILKAIRRSNEVTEIYDESNIPIEGSQYSRHLLPGVNLDEFDSAIERLAIESEFSEAEREVFSKAAREGVRKALEEARVAARQTIHQPDSEPRPKYLGVRKSGDPVDFLNEHWGADIQSGRATRASIRAADEPLLMAVYRACRGDKSKADKLLPPSAKEDLSGLTADELLTRRRSKDAEKARIRRASAKPTT